MFVGIINSADNQSSVISRCPSSLGTTSGHGRSFLQCPRFVPSLFPALILNNSFIIDTHPPLQHTPLLDRTSAQNPTRSSMSSHPRNHTAPAPLRKAPPTALRRRSSRRTAIADLLRQMRNILRSRMFSPQSSSQSTSIRFTGFGECVIARIEVFALG